VYDKFSVEMIRWLANDTSGIKCIQEYSTNSNWPALDVTRQIKEKGYHSYIYRATVLDGDHNPGMAIFSKYTILDSGIVFQQFNSSNAIIYADLEIKNRIIRIYNVHLASMNLQLRKSKSVEQGTNVLRKLKTGSVKRVEQLNALIKHAQSSPYPFIICGDFNETPYSYAYRQLTKFTQNSFESAGYGFGFTLNELPYLIRIDHQFYHSDITIEKFEVFRKMKISDHFPTYGYYNLN
jgi:endonuclease/exonuclease/phosphatase family metal-dependent hydrolase